MFLTMSTGQVEIRPTFQCEGKRLTITLRPTARKMLRHTAHTPPSHLSRSTRQLRRLETPDIRRRQLTCQLSTLPESASNPSPTILCAQIDLGTQCHSNTKRYIFLSRDVGESLDQLFGADGC